MKSKSLVYSLKSLFITLVFISCSTSSGSDEDSTDFRIGVINPTLQLMHNTHLGTGAYHVTRDLELNNNFTLTLSVEVFITEETDQALIDRILIQNDQSEGWDFNRFELDNAYVDSTHSFIFKELTFDFFSNDPGTLFNVQLLNDQKEVEFDRGFLIEYEVPLPLNTRNKDSDRVLGHNHLFIYFYSYDEEEYSGGSNKVEFSLYDTFTESDTLSLIWRDSNGIDFDSFGIPLETFSPPFNPITGGDIVQKIPLEDIPDNAFSFYFTFSRKTPSLVQRLVTGVDTVNFNSGGRF